MIRCEKCDAEMFDAKISSMGPVLPVLLTRREKGICGCEYRDELLCYVCPECGRIELYAKEPKKLKGRR